MDQLGKIYPLQNVNTCKHYMHLYAYIHIYIVLYCCVKFCHLHVHLGQDNLQMSGPCAAPMLLQNALSTPLY